MTDIHDALDKCRAQCEAMVKEIEKFKTARAMHQQSTQALDEMCAAMKRVTKEIHPYTENRLKIFMRCALLSMLLNAAVIAGIIVLFIRK